MSLPHTIGGGLLGGGVGTVVGAMTAAAMGEQVVGGPVVIACCLTGALIGLVWGASLRESK